MTLVIIGREIAFRKVMDDIWKLEGYLLQQSIRAKQ